MRAKSKELKPRLTLMTRASLNCRESSILRCTAVVRSVPWIKRVATRDIRTTIPQSYRVSSPEASNFGRRISGVGNQQHWMRASGIAGAGIRRRKSRALDDAACGSIRSPASTNTEVTGNADQIERVETSFDVNDPGKFELSREQHSPVHRRCS